MENNNSDNDNEGIRDDYGVNDNRGSVHRQLLCGLMLLRQRLPPLPLLPREASWYDTDITEFKIQMSYTFWPFDRPERRVAWARVSPARVRVCASLVSTTCGRALLHG